ncbi:MAG: hypothetical protein ACREE6_07725, partial [Limisphaerales bacterium]
RQYRKLYEEVVTKGEDEIDFNLNGSRFNQGKQGWFACAFSRTLNLFHGALLSIVLLVTFGLFIRIVLRLMHAPTD